VQGSSQPFQGKAIERKGAYLPHRTRSGAIYSVTFRLADSLPQSVLEAWKAEEKDILKTADYLCRPLSKDEISRLSQLRSEKFQKYLRAGHGTCSLKQEDIASMTAGALQHFHGLHYQLFAWCVMPNHVHTVVQPIGEHSLSDVLHSWKTFTAKQANKMLGREGTFWQAEYYDHVIRNEEELAHAIEYALWNPERAGLVGWKWKGVCQTMGTMPMPPLL